MAIYDICLAVSERAVDELPQRSDTLRDIDPADCIVMQTTHGGHQGAAQDILLRANFADSPVAVLVLVNTDIVGVT